MTSLLVCAIATVIWIESDVCFKEPKYWFLSFLFLSSRISQDCCQFAKMVRLCRQRKSGGAKIGWLVTLIFNFYCITSPALRSWITLNLWHFIHMLDSIKFLYTVFSWLSKSEFVLAWREAPVGKRCNSVTVYKHSTTRHITLCWSRYMCVIIITRITILVLSIREMLNKTRIPSNPFQRSNLHSPFRTFLSSEVVGS